MKKVTNAEESMKKEACLKLLSVDRSRWGKFLEQTVYRRMSFKKDLKGREFEEEGRKGFWMGLLRGSYVEIKKMLKQRGGA